MEEKFVTYKNLKIGQKIKGTKDGARRSFFTSFVKEINPAFVTVERWEKGGDEEKINSTLMFAVDMTQKEFEDKYQEKAKEILMNIGKKLNHDEIGYHEMWNAWLYGSPYEMAKYCMENKLTVVGHCTDIIPKTAMFSGDTLDVGVCAEYEDGERIWCHFRSSDIDEMLEKYKL